MDLARWLWNLDLVDGTEVDNVIEATIAVLVALYTAGRVLPPVRWVWDRVVVAAWSAVVARPLAAWSRQVVATAVEEKLMRPNGGSSVADVAAEIRALRADTAAARAEVRESRAEAQEFRERLSHRVDLISDRVDRLNGKEL